MTLISSFSRPRGPWNCRLPADRPLRAGHHRNNALLALFVYRAVGSDKSFSFRQHTTNSCQRFLGENCYCRRFLCDEIRVTRRSRVLRGGSSSQFAAIFPAGIFGGLYRQHFKKYRTNPTSDRNEPIKIRYAHICYVM